MRRPVRLIGRLAAALGLAAACLAPVAWLQFGAVGLEGVGYAALACFVPGVVLASIAGQFTGSQRAMQLLLLGTLLRVGIVLLVSLVLVEFRPVLRSTEFFVGLAVFYFVALAVETRELLAELGSANARVPQPNRQAQTH